eukprot:UN05817
MLFVHHATWCINSVAHYVGAQTFDDTNSARDSIIAGLLTLGEGYHNFHHEFPHDYRNGVKWYDYDPTKWFISAMNVCGLADDLYQFPMNEIVKGEVDMIEKRLAKRKESINYGVPLHSLAIWTKEEFAAEMRNAKENNKIYIVVSFVVYDVTQFVADNKHPGGKAILLERNGKDVTNGL